MLRVSMLDTQGCKRRTARHLYGRHPRRGRCASCRPASRDVAGCDDARPLDPGCLDRVAPLAEPASCRGEGRHFHYRRGEVLFCVLGVARGVRHGRVTSGLVYRHNETVAEPLSRHTRTVDPCFGAVAEWVSGTRPQDGSTRVRVLPAPPPSPLRGRHVVHRPNGHRANADKALVVVPGRADYGCEPCGARRVAGGSDLSGA